MQCQQEGPDYVFLPRQGYIMYAKFSQHDILFESYALEYYGFSTMYLGWTWQPVWMDLFFVDEILDVCSKLFICMVVLLLIHEQAGVGMADYEC